MGRGPPGDWADAIEAARTVAARGRASSSTSAPTSTRPGTRAAAPRSSSPSTASEALVGHAGELHPRVVEALGLPARTCAVELDLDRARAAAGRRRCRRPRISTYPVATQDVALVVDGVRPGRRGGGGAARAAPGELLESIRLFDVYTGEQVGEGNKSLAYTLRFRASDRTLTAEEATAARDAAVAARGRAHRRRQLRGA